MRKIERNILLVAPVFVLLHLAVLVSSAQVTARDLPEKTYEEVMDKMFPRTIPDQKIIDWQIVLRFVPFSSFESQMVIRKTSEGCSITKYKAIDGYAFNAISRWYLQHGVVDLSKMSTLVKVEHKETNVGKRVVNKLRNDLFETLPNASLELLRMSQAYDRIGGWPFQVDGAQYELWYVDKQNEFSFQITDKDTSDKITGNTSLVRWMNKVRLTHGN